jgi:hypothetical protein
MPKMFEPYTPKLGCLAVQRDGRWWVVHPNGDAEPAKSKDEAQERALYNNATGGQYHTRNRATETVNL